jgi:hypothetical protein
MSDCSVQLLTDTPQEKFERTCPTCKFKIVNQFVTKCPRCATKLSLADLCMGCFQNGSCHGEKTVKQKAE